MIEQQFDIIEMISNAGLVVQFVLLLLLFFPLRHGRLSWSNSDISGKPLKNQLILLNFFGKAAIYPMLLSRPNSFAAAPLPEFFGWVIWN